MGMPMTGRKWGVVLLGLLFIATGCGEKKQPRASIEKLVPNTSEKANFGDLYPHLNSLLETNPQDISTAVKDTRVWAEQNLSNFKSGSCAFVTVVNDSEFAKIFGRTTLGVTLPWMQIYIRTGTRFTQDHINSESEYVWRDPSLFVSTILHEFVHAMQRTRQAQEFFTSSPECIDSRDALVRRKGTWNTAFQLLRVSRSLEGGYYRYGEKEMLYRWTSPIERARDEVQASVMTIQWMAEHPDQLNLMTVGAANNWAYAAQYLGQLKALATSDCFSPDRDTFEEEKHIYENEIPRYIETLGRHEEAMRTFLNQHNIPVLNASLQDMITSAVPTGRNASECGFSAQLELPRLPLKDLKNSIEIEPIPID